MEIVEALKTYIAREIRSALDSGIQRAAQGAEDTLRFSFSGPPRDLLAELFDLLSGGGAGFGLQVGDHEVHIPVFLVDPHASDPASECPAARCTANYLVTMRNHGYRCLLVLHEVGAAINQSVTTAIKPLGLSREISDVAHWINEPVVSDLLEPVIRALIGDARSSSGWSCVKRALLESWDADQRYRDKQHSWKVVQRLLAFQPGSASGQDVLLAALGLPACATAELGTDEHLDVLTNLAAMLEAHGLTAGFSELERMAANDTGIIAALRALREHLRAKGIIEAGEFTKSPLHWYAPQSSDGDSLPSWWKQLTLDTWARLLDTNPPPSGRLEVRLLSSLSPTPRGMPALALNAVRFSATISDLSEDTPVTVGRASGLAKLQHTGMLTVPQTGAADWDDLAPPEHDRFLRYRFETRAHSPVTAKVIVLEQYTPGVVAVARNAKTATPFRLNRKAKDATNNTVERWECTVAVAGMGHHPLDLFVRSGHILSPTVTCHNTTAEQSAAVERPINQSDACRWTCLIETDEESFFDFSARNTDTNSEVLFRVYVTAEEVDPTEVNSHFQRLVLEHRGAATGEYPRTRVEPPNCRAADLEELAVEDVASFHPVVIGPDFLDAWKKPSWTEQPTLSRLSLPVDPRPSAAEMSPPQEFLDARKEVLFHLNCNTDDDLPSSAGLWPLFELMQDNAFRTAVHRLVDAYLLWLEQDYDSAIWSDVYAVHACQSGVRALEATPYAVLLTPLHPLRLAWQCHAQSVFQHGIDRNLRCPAASIVCPAYFPDCLTLSCRTGAGSVVRKSFAAMASSSDYWGVLWAVDALGRLGRGDGDPVLGDEFGITVDGLTAGFSAAQVVRSLDEVRRLMAGRTTLQVNVCADTTGPGSLNAGIEDWCAANIGPDVDCWAQSGPVTLQVVDHRPFWLQPEQAAMASLTSKSDAAIRWFDGARHSWSDSQDLSILAHLGTINHEFSVKGLRSAIDSSALTRWRVRKQVAGRDTTFIAESRVADKPSAVDRESLAGALLTGVDFVESRCRQWFDSYVFAPNMQLLGSAISSAAYCAVSSSSVDAACFFGNSGNSYLWDYELPSYARRAGENGGYYLLAQHSPSMVKSLRTAVATLGNEGALEDADAEGILEEISRRGMPTLKRLTTGGTTSLGEVGSLIALRMLQSEFHNSDASEGLLPVLHGGHTINLIVPADPFTHQFADLRRGLDTKSAERPDLLVLSVRYREGHATHLQITPIEVKARSAVMSIADRRAALEQASGFAIFLSQLRDSASGAEMWGIAYRGLLAALLDYGFRVYGQLSRFLQQDEWVAQHSAALRALGSRELETRIDARGRLVLIDASNSSTMADLDEDGFKETVVLSHRDALAILKSTDGNLLAGMRAHLGTWELQPQSDVKVAASAPPASSTLSTPTEPDRRDTSGITIHRPPTSSLSPDVNSPASDTPQSLPSERPATRQQEKGPSVYLTPEEAEDAAKSRGIQFPIGTSINSFTSEPVIFSPGITSLNHLNIGVVGDLGTGKTQLVQSLLYQMRLRPEDNRGSHPNILIFDYKRDYSKPEFVAATNATVIRPHKLKLNLFTSATEGVSGNLWLERTKFFCDVLDKLYPGIGPRQRQKIKQAVRTAYDDAASSGRSAPTLNDVFDVYASASGNDVDSPYSIMSDLVDGEYFVSSSADTIPFGDFLSGVVVIDLASVGQDDRTKNMLVVIFLNLFYEHMLRIHKQPFLGSSPQTRYVDTMLLVDEADNIMRYEFDVLKKILLQGREFGVGVLLASQYLSHFDTQHENYAEPLLTWCVHKVPNLSVRDLEGIGIANASIEMVNAVKSLQCHECLFKTAGIDGRFIRGTPFYELLAGTHVRAT